MGYSKHRSAARLGPADDSTIEPLDASCELIGLVERVRLVCRGYPARQLGEMTGTASETARRYAHGHRPSAEFLMGVCHTLGVSPMWLLRGEGPMLSVDLTAHYLSQVGAMPLCMEVGRRIERAGSGWAPRYQNSTASNGMPGNGVPGNGATGNGATGNVARKAGLKNGVNKNGVKKNGATRKRSGAPNTGRLAVSESPPEIETRVNGFTRAGGKRNGVRANGAESNGVKRGTAPRSGAKGPTSR